MRQDCRSPRTCWKCNLGGFIAKGAGAAVCKVLKPGEYLGRVLGLCYTVGRKSSGYGLRSFSHIVPTVFVEHLVVAAPAAVFISGGASANWLRMRASR